MSSLPYSLVFTLWMLVIAAETGLMILLLWRRAWRANPAFTVFVTFCVVRSCLLLCAKFMLKSSTMYGAIWWGAYIPQCVILIALVLEVVQIVFRPYEALPRGTRGNFVLAMLTVILLVAIFTVNFPGKQASEWLTFLRAMDQGVSWTLLGTFAIIAGFASALGIPWSHRVYGIVVGFVFYLLVDVVVVTVTAQTSLPARNIWPADMLAFLVACSEWTYYFARAEVPRRTPTIAEVESIATILSQYVFVIESLEIAKSPEANVRGELLPSMLRSEVK